MSHEINEGRWYLGFDFRLAGRVITLRVLRLLLPGLVQRRVILQQGVKQHNTLVLEEPIEVGVAV